MRRIPHIVLAGLLATALAVVFTIVLAVTAATTSRDYPTEGFGPVAVPSEQFAPIVPDRALPMPQEAAKDVTVEVIPETIPGSAPGDQLIQYTVTNHGNYPVTYLINCYERDASGVRVDEPFIVVDNVAPGETVRGNWGNLMPPAVSIEVASVTTVDPVAGW